MATYNVRLNGKLIDTVFYSAYATSGKDMTPDEVKQSLVEHDAYDENIKVSRKTVLEYVVQGNYGDGYGWEDLTAADNQKEALDNLKDYRQNGTAPVRLIKRRTKV